MQRQRPLALATSCALAALVLSASRPAAAQEALDPTDSAELPARGEPAPKPDLPSPATRWNLALTGLGVTGGFYGAALASSLIWEQGPWAPEMRIPVAGPWLAMKDLRCGAGEPNCGTALEIVRGILAGLDGVGQAGGLLITLEAVFLPVRSAQRARVSTPRKHAWVRPIPFVAGRDGVGLGFVGEL